MAISTPLITVAEAKKHLNIDESWVEDDELIRAYCKAAECAVENHI